MISDKDKLLHAKKLQERFDPEPSHSNQVTVVSLQLFDELKPLHCLGDKERLILHIAALLHDIGYYIDGVTKHHKNSMKLIMKHGTSGFSEKEKALIANIARYHRKANPDHKHKLWIALSEKDRTIVNKLSAILRIADGLDRSHQSPVRRISCKIQTSRVIFYIDYFGDINSELYGAEKKSELFKKIFSREAIFIPKRIQNSEH